MTSEGSAAPLPSIMAPAPTPTPHAAASRTHSVDSSAVSLEDDAADARIPRPTLGGRKPSGTMIVSRDEAARIVEHEEFDEYDVRTMSPRRNSEQVDQLSEEARKDLVEQARMLQKSLEAIVDRVETVKNEHEKLEGGNKFLQSYIGELMQTSKITSTAPLKSKGKSRSGK